MKIIRTLSGIHAWRRSISSRQSIGFVPTMGALHFGHLELVKRAKRENTITVVSIFVNPTQFGPKEDFKKYPRPWVNDLRLLRQTGADIVFGPTPDQMYRSQNATAIHVSQLTDTLCGSPASRGPAHFIGVATVVAKLFNLVRPTRAYFGLKDYQQVRVIEQMTSDLNFDLQIVRCPTIREKDGLAVSSRNAYLSSVERAKAPRLYAALQQGAKLLRSQPKMGTRAIGQSVKKFLISDPDFKIDYIEIVDPETLQPAQRVSLPMLIAAAVKLGNTRLIDNIVVK